MQTLKICFWLLVLAPGCLIHAVAKDENLLIIFNEQVDAFNQRDVNRLVNNVSDDFKYFFITSDEMVLESAGKVDFRKGMEKYFDSRKNKIISTIVSYQINGDKISFKEVVFHTNKAGAKVESSALGVYQIRRGKIFRAWYFLD